MKSFRYLITVLALVNASLVAQASAAHHQKGTSLSTTSAKSHTQVMMFATGSNHGSE